jgi:hypothetical protein
MTDCDLLRVNKKAMMEAVHGEHAFPDMFVAYLLARNIRYEEELVDQLFNSSEKRLARVLLLLAHFGKGGHSGKRGSQDQSGDPGRDDRHHSLATQLFHEPVQEAGFHPLQRRIPGPQLAAQCRAPRLALRILPSNTQSASREAESAWRCPVVRWERNLGRTPGEVRPGNVRQGTESRAVVRV